MSRFAGISSAVSGRLVWLVLFVVCVLTFRAMDVFEGAFDASGPRVMVSSYLRISLPVFVFLTLYGWGVALAGPCLGLRAPERVALCTLAGFGLCNAVMLLLGAATNYAWAGAFLFGCVGVYLGGRLPGEVFRACRERANWRFVRERWCEIALFALFLLSIADNFLRNVNFPILTNDGDTWTHYIPYYIQAITYRMGFFPADFFAAFFHNKGNGPQLYLMSLADITTGGLASFALLWLLALEVYLLVTLFARSATLAMAGIVLLSFSSVCRALNFYKIHLGNIVLSIGIFLMMLLLPRVARSGRMSLALVVLSAGAVVYYPFNLAILAMFVGVAAVYLAYARDEARSVALWCFSAACAAFLAVVGYNLWRAGLAEFSLPLFWKFSRPEPLLDWVGQWNMRTLLSYLQAVIPMQNVASNGWLHDMLTLEFREYWLFLRGNSPWVVFTVTAFLAAGYVVALRGLRRDRYLLYWCVAIVLILTAVTTALMILKHNAALRFFMFFSIIQILLLCSALRFGLGEGRTRWVAVAVVVLLSGHFLGNLSLSEWGFYSKMFRGEASYLDYYSHNVSIKKVYKLQEVHEGVTVVLNESSPLLAVPGVRVVSNWMNTNPVLNGIVAATPSEAAAFLRGAGVRRAYVDLKENFSPVALLPLFEPSAVAVWFDPEDLGDGCYLLRLRDEPSPGRTFPAYARVHDVQAGKGVARAIYECSLPGTPCYESNPFRRAFAASVFRGAPGDGPQSGLAYPRP